MTQLASITVGAGVFKHAMPSYAQLPVQPTDTNSSSAIRRLLRGLQEQVHGFLPSGLLPQRRLVTRTAQSKSHRSHRIRRKR